jgi:hypothetical protein
MSTTLIEQLRKRAESSSLASDREHDFPQTPDRCLDEGDIAGVERQLGFPVPPLLRDVYLHVGNGGWGPGHGLLPLVCTTETSDEESVSGLYEAFAAPDPEDPAWTWPRHLLPICDWGCAIRTCVDCDLPLNPIFTFDPNALEHGDPTEKAIAPIGLSLKEWFEAWISGVDLWSQMFEPDPDRAITIMNPFTKKPTTRVPTKLRRVPWRAE